jgi:hypothetical protein
MSWHLQLGFDERIMHKVDPKQVERQRFIFSILTLMLVAVALIVFFSCLVYSLVLFHNWPISIIVSIFLSLVVFNIYRFLVVSAVNASYSGLSPILKNHEKAYDEFLSNDLDFTSFTESQIQHLINAKKEYLRSIFPAVAMPGTSVSSGYWTMLIRISIITVFAIIFSTGIELFIFRESINEVLYATKVVLIREQPNSFILNDLLRSKNGEEFIWFNCNSLLFLLNILNSSLGNWKLFLDIIFLAIFLMPIVLVFRSREVLFGSYVQELALHEIAISHYHYLRTQKLCGTILKSVLQVNVPHSTKR